MTQSETVKQFIKEWQGANFAEYSVTELESILGKAYTVIMITKEERDETGNNAVRGILNRVWQALNPAQIDSPFVFSDGGRQEAGFKGFAGDCVTRSIAIVTGKPYREVYTALNALGKSERITKRNRRKSNARTGVGRHTYERYLKSLGFKWVPCMHIGSGCQIHLKAEELPAGRLVIRLSGHVTAFIDGKIYDIYNPSRGGTRCVYGYFVKPEEPTETDHKEGQG